MNTFIGLAIEVIHSAGLPSTVGHRFYGDLTSRRALPWESFTPPQSFLYYAGSKPQFRCSVDSLRCRIVKPSKAARQRPARRRGLQLAREPRALHSWRPRQ